MSARETMQRILLTRGARLLGSNVAERLVAHGDRVLVLDRFNDCHDPSSSAAYAAALEAGNLAKSVTVE